ncbi:heat shock protein 67B1 [Spodoptera frugiperda]|uniref:Heat shock protein 67B1 n=1 Tax=Spodoptera frugiperda TaxID=7108 RepID=A0A9R0EIA5_SPOFR|nr:heat shock protein 67B1 [Spodoptera frugiperda]
MEYPRLCPARWSDDHFGMCMPSREFMCPFYDTHSSYFRPWRLMGKQSIAKEIGSTIENDKGNYKITMDVQHYKPEEISVRVTDNEIIVEGKHEDRPDAHGYISRQFRRRYALPNHCPGENVTSSMSSDGILIIVAEKKSASEKQEKIVPIKMCGFTPKRTQIETKMTSEITQNSVKENIKDTEDMNRNKTAQIMLKEEHSRLLKPELLKETIQETNGDKFSSKQVVELKGLSEKKDEKNIGATASKIEESFAKSTLGMSGLTEKIGEKSLASTSDLCGMKTMSNMSKTIIEESSSSFKSSSSMHSTMKASGKMGEFVTDIISAELKEAAENV